MREHRGSWGVGRETESSLNRVFSFKLGRFATMQAEQVTHESPTLKF